MTELGEAFVDVLARIAPFLLLGFAAAGLLHALVPSRILARALGGTGKGPIIRGALVGIPLPLCSCGVVPVAAELHKQGAGRGATAAFLVATPETGVDSISTSFAVLHPLMVVFRPLSALITAIAAGAAIERWTTTASPPVEPERACCHHGEDEVRGDAKGMVGGMRYAFDDLFGDVATYLIPAILLTAALTVWIEVPARVTETIESPLLQMLLMMVVGIPVYVCATAATPVAAALILAGFSPGAALVFLLAGPATNLMTITAVANMMGRRAAVIYCTTIAVFSLAFGALLDALYFTFEITHDARAGVAHDHTDWLGWTSTAIVAALVVAHLARKIRRVVGA